MLRSHAKTKKKENGLRGMGASACRLPQKYTSLSRRSSFTSSASNQRVKREQTRFTAAKVGGLQRGETRPDECANDLNFQTRRFGGCNALAAKNKRSRRANQRPRLIAPLGKIKGYFITCPLRQPGMLYEPAIRT